MKEYLESKITVVEFKVGGGLLVSGGDTILPKPHKHISYVVGMHG